MGEIKEYGTHRFYGGKIIGDVLYFSELSFNGLFKANLLTGITEFVDCFADEPLDAERLHRKAIIAGHKLLFLPQWGDKIHIYDLISGEQTVVFVPQQVKGKAVADAAILDECIFLFPMRNGQPFYKINLRDYTIHEDIIFNLWSKQKQDIYADKKYQFNRIVVKENYVWAAIYGTQIICCFDLLNGKVEEYVTGIKNIQNVYNSENGLWVSCLEDSNVYHWNCNNGCISTYINQTILVSEEVYAQIIEYKNEVYAIPTHSKDVYMLSGDLFCKIICSDNIYFAETEEYSFFGYDLTDEFLWIFPYAADAMLLITGNQISRFPILFNRNDEKYIKKLYENICKKSEEIFYESNTCYLEIFLLLFKNNTCLEQETFCKGKIG